MTMILPTPANVAVLFLDLQEGLVQRGNTLPLDHLRRNANALAKLVALHQLPHWLSATAHGGTFIAEVLGALEGSQPRVRAGTTAFADEDLVQAIKACGRPILVLAGCASEIIVQRTALDALVAGYTVHVAVDACTGVSARTEEAAWRRIAAGGAVTTSVTTLAAELVVDPQSALAGQTLQIMIQTLGS